MIEKKIIFPFYAKATILLVGLFALITMFYIAQNIIVPLIFAIIIAIVLLPIVDFFVRRKINRVIAILITLFITFLVITGFCMLIFSQASLFSESWPILVNKLTTLLNETITNASKYLDINPARIHEWIIKTKGELVNTSSAAIGRTLINLGSGLVVLFLVPTYVFIILYYKNLLLDFIHKVFVSSNQKQISEIVLQIKNVIQRYLIGLLIEFVIVSILHVTALLMLGIQYAILLGILGALLNVIPYIGGIVGVSLPVMIALVTKSTPWYALYVMIAYYVIQLIDNNYIVPVIVSSKVKINALFSIIVVFVGNALWGIPGMFLSLPLLAIIKVIFDHIEPLKPWGFLLGDTMPPLITLKKLKL